MHAGYCGSDTGTTCVVSDYVDMGRVGSSYR
jgi:hypothetical protein